MRSRILIVGLMAAAAGACSAPAEQTSEPPEPPAEALDLALTGTVVEPAIASELEAPRPEPQHTGTSRPAVRRPAEPKPIGSPAAVALETTAAPADVQESLPSHPRVDETVEPVRGPHASEAVGGKPKVPVTEGAGRVPDPGSGMFGPVIIRGGNGQHGDDWVSHRPPEAGDVRPPSGTGVLINDRTPRRGPTQVADRGPVREGTERGPIRGPGGSGGRGGIR